MTQGWVRTILRWTTTPLMLASSALSLALVFALASTVPAQSSVSRTAIVLSLDGAVGPATADYVVRGIEAAAADGAAAVVLRIDTPGGLDTSMREIVRAILGSSIPVLGWVGPNGARAASAGTFILLAAHVAAMAPATNLGAATPVALFGGSPAAPSAPVQSDKPDKVDKVDKVDKADKADKADEKTDSGSARALPASASNAKALNDAVAYVRSLATMRGRNADWAERAVRDAASLPADEALREGVIDFVAADVRELLVMAHGREVRVGKESVVLDTRDLITSGRDPSWKTRVLAVLANPNVALILMMVGVYGLLLEFMNPGSLVAGTIGGISLLLGLYSLAALPLNLAGIALLLLGLGLLVAEAFVPSFGVLGIGGAVAFVLGATVLVDGVPGFEIAWPLALGIAVAGLALGFIIARLAVGSLRHPVRTGEGAMVGQFAQIIDWNANAGHVFVHGERWRAVSASTPATVAAAAGRPAAPSAQTAFGAPAFAHGARVRIIAVEGLTLQVEPAHRDKESVAGEFATADSAESAKVSASIAADISADITADASIHTTPRR